MVKWRRVSLTEETEFFEKGLAGDGEEPQISTGRGQDEFVRVEHVECIGDPHSCASTTLSTGSSRIG